MSREHPRTNAPDDNREPSLQDCLDAVLRMDTSAVTTTDVRILLGCSESAAHRRLTELFNEGILQRRDTEQQTLWSLTDGEKLERSFADLEPVAGPETNAVELIEASETHD